MKRSLWSVCLILLVCIICASTRAQAPGYMGKRFVVGYGLYVNPAFNSIALNYSDKPINMLHECFAEFAAGKKNSLGISAQFYRYTYNNIEPINALGYGSSSMRQRTENPEGNYQISARNYKFYSKFYKRNYLAPWGRYFLLGFVINRYTTTYDPNDMYVNVDGNYNSSYGYGSTTLYNDWGPTTETHKTFDVFFGNGNSRILSNNIVLDYGYSIGMIAIARMVASIDGAFGTLTTDDYISETALNRISAVNRFNCYLKIGYLF
jgi:hypothetical protein